MTCVSAPLHVPLIQPALSVPASVSARTAFVPSHHRHLAENADSLPWGDSIHSHPEELHRIYFQNIDGLCNDQDEIDLYIASMSPFHIGTFCWADPGFDFSIPHQTQT
jgi:hypothetical protein